MRAPVPSSAELVPGVPEGLVAGPPWRAAEVGAVPVIRLLEQVEAGSGAAARASGPPVAVVMAVEKAA